MGATFPVASGMRWPGTIAQAAALAFGAPVSVAAVVCALVTTIICMGAVWFDWPLPEQRSWMVTTRTV